MLTPVSLPLVIWIVASIAWSAELALTWRARRRYRRAVRKYRAATKRLDTAAAALGDDVDDGGPVATVTQLGARRSGQFPMRLVAPRPERPLHELDYVRHTTAMRDESR
ncbi:hypothetical protein [Nocardia neocaledoniensis]|uniref:hypothetical protein n=1 Tax=Nocardia neocaledoniensis TaxID=236511 RepID=UPI002457DAFC|nr:hypothetical protein [Nocardia neocaledoniensis]